VKKKKNINLLFGEMMIKIIKESNDYLFWADKYGSTFHTTRKKTVGLRGAIVEEMLARWGMVAAIPDGEDSKGRSKLRLSTPQELVVRAFEITDLFLAKLGEEEGITEVTREDIDKAFKQDTK